MKKTHKDKNLDKQRLAYPAQWLLTPDKVEESKNKTIELIEQYKRWYEKAVKEPP